MLMTGGTILILNGTSSSGKSTIAKALQESREAARGDRLPGLASAHYPFIRNLKYDFGVDTSELRPEEAAKQIRDFVLSGVEPSAFRAISHARV